MMQVKKYYFPKTSNGNILDISMNIENFVIKMQDKIKNRKLIINKYVKIINSTKKEYDLKQQHQQRQLLRATF